MKARVIKTGEIVKLITKQGKHYLDSSYNPYTEEELSFNVPMDAKSDTLAMPDLTRMFFNPMQYAVQIAVEYMKNNQKAKAKDVVKFTKTVINGITL